MITLDTNNDKGGNNDDNRNKLIGDKNIECEPTPSFILCIKKMSNA